ncbi:MAG: hypothetical protein KF819_05835 [Labilithrix sp.]|nr:hypothetical protein [Labilithrix sp.]
MTRASSRRSPKGGAAGRPRAVALGRLEMACVVALAGVSPFRASPRATLRSRRTAVALAAASIPAGSSAFTVLDVESILARLSAEARARVIWARGPIQEVLFQLQEEPLTDELVASAARRAWNPVWSLSRAFREAFATNPEQWRAALAADLKRDGEILERIVADEDSRETLRWIFGLLRSYYDLVVTAVPPDVILSAPEGEIAGLADDKDFQPLFAGQIALLAAIDAAKVAGRADRARDLLDVAFLELKKAQVSLQRHGLWLTPFPSETQEQRGDRAIRYAERLREVLSEEDVQVLDAARLQTLR